MSALCCSNLPAETVVKFDKNKDDKKTGSKINPPKTQLQYGVEDVPAPHLCLLFGLQQLFLSISSTITVPLVVSVNICIGDLYAEKAKLMSTFLFMCGVCTIMQCLIGVRLPILQGGCHKFLPAIAALMSLETWKCPDMSPYTNANSTLDPGEVWKPRIREIQGGIMVASLFQILVGSTGLLGVLLNYIGPITIVPTVSLVGLSLINVAQKFCETHWGISALTVGLLFLFSLYLANVDVPLPAYSRQNGFHIIRYPLFKLMPVILAVVISWALCALLTVFDVAPASLRTDAKSVVLESAEWFFFPYPGQWGLPTVSVAGVIAMLAVTISSVIESVGVFYACARTCEVPPPPAHAVNRGIAVEGIGSLISGAVGSGGATTSYSQNVGAIGFTRVASRSAFYVAGAVFLLGGIVGKVGAFLTTVPDPVLGGIVLVSFGMVTSVGLAALSFIEMTSARNMTIIGTSMLVGLMVPRFIEQNPNAINTGDTDLDRVIAVLLGTSMFVGGVMAFLLDNTVPGNQMMLPPNETRPPQLEVIQIGPFTRTLVTLRDELNCPWLRRELHYSFRKFHHQTYICNQMMLPPNETRPPQLEVIQIGPFTRTLVTLRDELNCPWLRRELHYSFRKFHHQTYICTVEERGIEKWRSEVEFVSETNEEEIETGSQSEQDNQKKEIKVDNATDISNGNLNYTKHIQNDILTDEAIFPEDRRTSNGDVQNNDPRPVTNQHKRSLYDIPLVTPFLNKLPFTRYLPFLPNFAYSQFSFSCKKCKRCRRNNWKPRPMATTLSSSAGVGDHCSP